MKLKKVHSVLLATALSCSLIVTPVFAEPDDTSSLEAQKAAAEAEVSDLQSQLSSLMTTLNDLQNQLIQKGEEIIQAKEDLAIAEEKQQQQYEDMKLRIKYMYEEGDSSAAERLLSSGSIAEVLSQAEYVQRVHSYDRDMLDEYVATVQEVENLKTTLESDVSKLESMETEYQTQSDELNATLVSKSAEVENLDAMIQEAARAAVEAAAAQAAAEAAAAEQAAAEAQQAGGTGTVTETSSSGNSGGSSYVESTPSYSTSTPEPSYDVSTGNAVVDRAYSWVGRAEYVWGGCSPGAFDCSGFVSYCLTGSYSRLGTTYTFLTWPQVSNPQPGDVCVNANHTGIYIGGGQMIHASTYGVGVIVGPVQGGMIYVRY